MDLRRFKLQVVLQALVLVLEFRRKLDLLCDSHPRQRFSAPLGVSWWSCSVPRTTAAALNGRLVLLCYLQESPQGFVWRENPAKLFLRLPPNQTDWLTDAACCAVL